MQSADVGVTFERLGNRADFRTVFRSPENLGVLEITAPRWGFGPATSMFPACWGILI
jgi:hypothetical protein